MSDTAAQSSATSGSSIVGQTFEISKSVGFEAAHRLPGGPDDHPYGRVHGHSFRLTASVKGVVQIGRLWVEDLAVLDSALRAVAADLDHQLLNDISGLETPTLERIALWAADRLSPVLPGLSTVTISRPSLSESCTLQID
ncbi:MAG: 6-carboxytetrahydropterin synthase [Pseudomonadota bacterium]